MSMRSLLAILFSALFTMVLADIGPALPIQGDVNHAQFGGRQSAFANGDTIAFCYIQYSNTSPDFGLYPGVDGTLVYKYSENGGRNFETRLSLDVSRLDGLPTLTKSGQEVIITFSADFHINRYYSYDNGLTFSTNDSVSGSDKLPITDIYDGAYHSCYTYQDFSPLSWQLEDWQSSGYGNFIDYYGSSNNTTVHYWGPDVIDGTLRSNGDVWLKQFGGGTNNGWPTFNDPVITSGQIQSFSGTPPYAQVFRGGYYENCPLVDLTPVASQILSQGIPIGSTAYDPNRIMMVTVNGPYYSSWVGDIVTSGFDTLWVYSSYPPGNGEPLYANIIPHVDTLWTPGPNGLSAGHMNIVSSTLWIKGNFSGNQVWYSKDKVFIMDDILLSGTPVGTAPDGSDANGHYNPDDKVAIVSAKSIYIQYGYRAPQDSIRYKPNCGSDADGVWIYASLYALGDGDGNTHQDGVFTFEYQHPHPSVPAVNLTAPIPGLYDNIDLHRRHFPQTTANPWPGNIDYPYYNPLWPEGNPTTERGTVHVYGSIFQRRRGYMHRNLADAEFPNPTQIWDIELDLCGGPAGNIYNDPVLGITFHCISAPGASGAGIGYKKDFHNDRRIKRETFGFNPNNFSIKMGSATQSGQWQMDTETPGSFDMLTKAYDRKFGKTVFSINDHLFRYNHQENTLIDVSNYMMYFYNIKGNITQVNLLDENHALFSTHDKNIGFSDTSFTPDTLRVYIINLTTLNETLLMDSFVPTEMNDINVLDNGLKLIAKTNSQNEVQIYALDQDAQLIPFYTWNPDQAMLSSTYNEFSKARLYILPSGNDSLYVFIWLPYRMTSEPWLSKPTNGTLFIARGALPNTALPEENEVPVPVQKVTVSSYPNPFTDNAALSVSLEKDSRLAISIYNVKGELIKTFDPEYKKAGTHKFYWNGRNDQDKALPTGVYYYKCSAEEVITTGKMLLLK